MLIKNDKSNSVLGKQIRRNIKEEACKRQNSLENSILENNNRFHTRHYQMLYCSGVYFIKFKQRYANKKKHSLR